MEYRIKYSPTLHLLPAILFPQRAHPVCRTRQINIFFTRIFFNIENSEKDRSKKFTKQGKKKNEIVNTYTENSLACIFSCFWDLCRVVICAIDRTILRWRSETYQFDIQVTKRKNDVTEISLGPRIKCPSQNVVFGIEYLVEKYFTRAVRNDDMVFSYVSFFPYVIYIA